MPRFARAVSRSIPLSLAVAAIAAAFPALALQWDDKPVKPQSPAIQQVYREPLDADAYALRVALEKLRYAEDKPAAAALARYDAWAKVERPAHDRIVLKCDPEPRTSAVLAPGEERTHRCEVYGNRFAVDEYFRSIADRWPAGSPLRIEATQLTFTDPPVALWELGAAWSDPLDGARSEAVRALRALDCKERGACLEDAKDKYLSYPNLFFLYASAAGLLGGALAGAAGGHAMRNAFYVALAWMVVGVVVAVRGPAALGVGGYAAVGLFVLGIAVVAVSLVAFLLGAWAGAWLRRR